MKLFKTILATSLCVLAAGCADDLSEGFDSPGEGGLRVDYLVDGEVNETRSVPAVQDEIKLESALIFFYDLDTRKAVDYVYVRPAAGTRTLSFDPPAGLGPDTDYNTLVLGNPDSYTDAGDAEAMAESLMDLDYEAARVEIMYTRRAAITRGNPGTLPMFGQFVDAARKTPKTFRYREQGDVVTADGLFYFSRAVSRIDLENFVPGTLLVESVKVINYQSTGYPLTEGMRGSAIVDFAHSGDGGWMDVDAPLAGETQQSLSSSLYCFPNIVTVSQPDDNVTTALLIKGRYCEAKDGSAYDAEPTYYRFNLTNTGKGQVLSRNYAYRASIKGVKRRGASTPDVAVKDKTPIFDYDVTDDWQATDDSAVSDDKGNFMIISKTFVTFDGDDDLSAAVTLSVRTNNDLVWSVEPDDTEESVDNSFFICEKTDDSTLRVAPKETNNTPYVRFGRFSVTGRSASDPSVELKLTVNIQQLTTEFNYSMLTVDGCTGTITRRLNPNGGVLRLKVLAGAASNAWFAVDESNAIKNWGVSSHFSELGTNGSDLEIAYDANVTGSPRSTTLKVYLDPDINKDGVVKPVYVTLTQDLTTDLFTLSPAPVDGAYTIDCCSYDNIPTLTPHQGNIHANSFTVTVTPAAGVSIAVSSNFNNRDIVIDPFQWTSGNQSPNNASIITDKSRFVTNGTHWAPQTFYISAEAMAPDDGMITEYKMYFKATDRVSGNVQERMVTFRLKAIDGDINDCIFKVGDAYYLVTDRNTGTVGRVDVSGEKQEAKYVMNSGKGIIPGFQESKPLSVYTQFIGSILNSSNAAQSGQLWIRDVNRDMEMRYSPFYMPEDYLKWEGVSSQVMARICSGIIFSKCRAFVLSDFPRIAPDGRRIPVFRWINMTNIHNNFTTDYCPGIRLGLVNSTWNSGIASGQSFPMRRLGKEEVRRYLLDYLGYSEATLPAELK